MNGDCAVGEPARAESGGKHYDGAVGFKRAVDCKRCLARLGSVLVDRQEYARERRDCHQKVVDEHEGLTAKLPGGPCYERYAVESSERMVGCDHYAAVGRKPFGSRYAVGHIETFEGRAAEFGSAQMANTVEDIVHFTLAD